MLLKKVTCMFLSLSFFLTAFPLSTSAQEIESSKAAVMEKDTRERSETAESDSGSDWVLTGEHLSEEAYLALLAEHPEILSVTDTDSTLPDSTKFSLMDSFPQIQFTWNVTVFGVETTTDVEFLDLSDIQGIQIPQLEELLPRFPNLKQVDMVSCGIDNETMEALNQRHDAIKFVWGIQIAQVYLRTDTTAFIPVKLGAWVVDRDLGPLKYFHDMVAIDFGHMGITDCSWASEMPHLRYLILADTQVSDISPLADHKELVYLELFVSKVTDLSPLVSCTALEDLNVCYLKADPEPILKMTWLKRLWWSGSWYERERIYEALPEIDYNYYTVSSTADGWRNGKLYYEMRDYFGMPYMVG